MAEVIIITAVNTTKSEFRKEVMGVSEIVRYALVYGVGGTDLKPYEDTGEWVRYKDVEPLLPRIAELEQERNEALGEAAGHKESLMGALERNLRLAEYCGEGEREVGRLRGRFTVPIVCLCGSTRFSDAFRKANLKETLAGKIVLSIGCDMRTDDEIFGHLPEDELERIKKELDELHFRKIELADEVLILNVGGYIGYSTGRELAHARKLGKKIRFLEGGGD